MSLPPIVVTATYSSASAGTPSTQLASAQVSPPTDSSSNIMHGYIPALTQLQASINAELTARLHLDAASDKSTNASRGTEEEKEEEQAEEDDEVEEQEDDIDDKHTLPANVLDGDASVGGEKPKQQDRSGAGVTNKRPRLD